MVFGVMRAIIGVISVIRVVMGPTSPSSSDLRTLGRRSVVERGIGSGKRFFFF